MQVPETPRSVRDLDLMKRLHSYASGLETWDTAYTVGNKAQAARQTLHTNLADFVENVLNRLLDRVNAREMETFTMHDRTHGLKVAHLMWHILSEERRRRLTPPEIAMLVLSAHLHDVGMALNAQARAERLAVGSDLWSRLEVQQGTKARLDSLREKLGNPDETVNGSAEAALNQAEEALLCQDTRERHATRERYFEVLRDLRGLHELAPENVPDLDACLSFDGDSFHEKLVDICISHNEDAGDLVRRDGQNPARPRFPRNFPVGCATADLHMIAAALRLADILDFDRERTPPVLFHYLIPTALSDLESRSALEWRKHLSISNWSIEEHAIVFRGRCNDHVVHHAVVQFCQAIQNEISATRATFGALREEPEWDFRLPVVVKAEIHEEGYHYVPYQFQLDDQRVYELLMGGAIYENPLVAVRELVQNAVDACRLRDALTQLTEPYIPLNTKRIFVRYEEPHEGASHPILSVIDTGTGMDEFILKEYFLNVGRSYYHSAEFNRERVALSERNLDFAPVSEFGIGFLSCFLLADRVHIETALWESRRGDTRKRLLIIDGPTRLIRLDESSNDGPRRFKGTSVRLFLCRGGNEDRTKAPNWKDIREYIEDICQDLPYRLHLEHVAHGKTSEGYIDPRPLNVDVPAHLEAATLRIPVDDKEFGLEGELTLTNVPRAQEAERALFNTLQLKVGTDSKVEVGRSRYHGPRSPYAELLRGGFKIGTIPGLPFDYLDHIIGRGRLRSTWRSQASRRYVTPNLARTSTSDDRLLSSNVTRIWLSFLLDRVEELPEGQIARIGPYDYSGFTRLHECTWLQRYDAYTVYRLAANGWRFELTSKWRDKLEEWEAGQFDDLWLGEHKYDLYGQLLFLVLPRITSLRKGEFGDYYAARPVDGWKSILRSCRDFVTKPVKWPLFIEYLAPIENLLYYEYPGNDHLNAKFEGRFRAFTVEDKRRLVQLLYALIRARSERKIFSLTQTEAELLLRANESCGDLEVGSMHGSWQLRSFVPTIP